MSQNQFPGQYRSPFDAGRSGEPRRDADAGRDRIA